MNLVAIGSKVYLQYNGTLRTFDSAATVPSMTTVSTGANAIIDVYTKLSANGSRLFFRAQASDGQIELRWLDTANPSPTLQTIEVSPGNSGSQAGKYYGFISVGDKIFFDNSVEVYTPITEEPGDGYYDDLYAGIYWIDAQAANPRLHTILEEDLGFSDILYYPPIVLGESILLRSFDPKYGDDVKIIDLARPSIMDTFDVSTGALPHYQLVSAATLGDRVYYSASKYGLGHELVAVGGQAPEVQVSISVSNVTVSEAGGFATIELITDQPVTEELEVALQISGSATAGIDYATPPNPVFAPGTTSTTIFLVLFDDFVFEAQEQISVTLAPSFEYNLGLNNSATVTVEDNDLPPTISLAATSLGEANEGDIVTIKGFLSAPSDRTITVPLNFSGSASGSDYSVSPVLVFQPGALTGFVDLTVVNDTVGEGTELILVSMGTPNFGNLASSANAATSSIITIPQNDLAVPSFTRSSSAYQEDIGIVNFTVRLSNPAASDVVIPFSLSGNAGSSDRQLLTPSPLVIAAGQLTADIQVRIIDDSINETAFNERFEIQLETPTSGEARLGSMRTTTARILDNDQPSISFVKNTPNSKTTPSGVEEVVWENDGTTSITVRLSQPSSVRIEVPLLVSGVGKVPDGQAEFGASKDYSLALSPIVFAPGQTSVTRTVTLVDNTKNESIERFNIRLGTPTDGDGYLGTRATQIFTIRDNDPLVTVSGNVADIKEATVTKKFTVSLSSATNVDTTVPLTWGGTADRSGSDRDYTTELNFPKEIVIPAGSSSFAIDVNILEDSRDEPDETITYHSVNPPVPRYWDLPKKTRSPSKTMMLLRV